MKIESGKTFMLILFALTINALIMTGFGYSQMLPGSPDSSASYHARYDLKPDSLFFDGNLVPTVNKKIYRLKPGIYNIRAVRECYKPIETTLEVTAHGNELLRLQFEEIASDAAKRLSVLNRYSYLVGGAGIVGSFFPSGGLKNGLPMLLARVGTNFFWHRRTKNKFNECFTQYRGKPARQGGWRFTIGASSFLKKEIEYVSRERVQHIFRSPGGANLSLIWDTEMILRINPNDDYAANQGLHIGLERALGERLAIAFDAEYLPGGSHEFTMKDTTAGFSQRIGGTTVQEDQPFYLLNASIRFPLASTTDQRLMFSIGGYMSNKISRTQDVPLTVPNLPQFQDSTASIPVTYEFQAIGVNLGLHYNYYFANKFAVYFDYLFYPTSRLQVNDEIRRSPMFVLNGGVNLNF